MPVRIRVTAAFSVALALVLVGIGAFVHLRLAHALDESIDNGLRARAQDLAAVSGRGLTNSRGLIEPDETLAQVLAADGRVLDATAGLDAPIARPAQRPRFTEVSRVGRLESRVRLLAVPAGGGTVIVGASLGDRDEALHRQLTLLLAGGAAGLVLASLAGYWAIGRALAPVEAMRRRAEHASLTDRLPVTDADDELRRLGETLNAMLDRLQAGVERERRFVDDASHELRTPLTLLRTELELALRGDGDPRAAIASAIEEVDRLSGLADALLALARAGEVQPAEIDARALLDAVAARFPAAIEVDAAGTITADRHLIEQALTSLVDNALRHGRGTVTLTARDHTVTVSDEGEGDIAFDRRGRLGLSIVTAIAEAHGGTATARGATVTLRLP
jgi:two-component system OmpR family sensor kinase